jgi:hypothetical protein
VEQRLELGVDRAVDETFVAQPETVLSVGIGLEGLSAQGCVHGALDLLQCQLTALRDRGDLRCPGRPAGLAGSLPDRLCRGLHGAVRNLAGHRSVTPAHRI